MLGGGHVRRRSVDSGVDGSPCVPLERERKKHTAIQHLASVLKFDRGDDELPTSVQDRMSKISIEHDYVPDRPSKLEPEKMVVPKPSIASTSSDRFGLERMIVAGKGLLERQSLEESALMAQGEDIVASCKCCSYCFICLSFDQHIPDSREHSRLLSSWSRGSFAVKHSDLGQLRC